MKKKPDLERDQQKAKALFTQRYESFMTSLCSKSRAHQEIIDALYAFRDDLLKEGEYMESIKLGDYHRMTMSIVDQKITLLTAQQIVAENRGNAITQHTPGTEVDRGAVAKVAGFKTKEELLALDFVDHFAKQPGFTGFTWKRVEKRDRIEFFLLAMYGTGDSWLVGTCVSDFGLMDIPEYTEEAA